MSIEALEGISDEELFNDANSDETAVEPATEPAEAPAEQTEQPTAETPAVASAEATAPAVEDRPSRTVADDNAPQVPSWRVREINEEKRLLAAENERIKAELAQARQAQQQPRVEPPKPVEKPARPDPLLDPDGYAAAIRQELREEALNERREESLVRARESNQAEFDEAYQAAQKAVDPALKARMQSSRDPGKTLLEWHREQKTRAEVGNDPDAYFTKRFDEFLKDPANQTKVLERIRGGVQPQQPGATRQPSPVNLPPSLTRATNASADVSADDNDVSDDGLWRHANA